MWISSDSPEVRLTGRWASLNGTATATAAGSYFEASYTGELATLRFDMANMADPLPHLWIQVDDGPRIESVLAAYLRVRAKGNGPHRVTVILKGAVEQQSRWEHPLVGKISFLGLEAEGTAPLAPDIRPTIELPLLKNEKPVGEVRTFFQL